MHGICTKQYNLNQYYFSLMMLLSNQIINSNMHFAYSLYFARPCYV